MDTISILSENRSMIENIGGKALLPIKSKDGDDNESFLKELNYEVESIDSPLDFYLAPLQAYELVVVVDYKLSTRLFEEFKKSLVLGGKLFLQAPKSVEGYKNFELIKMLRGWNILFYDEREDNVKLIASKPEY